MHTSAPQPLITLNSLMSPFLGDSFYERAIIFSAQSLGQNLLTITLMRIKKCTAKFLNQI